MAEGNNGTARQSGAGGTPPYPGLRPFNRDEAYLFFGRDDCVESMVETLEETRFLAVLGPSGSGKSSLVRSGLFLHLDAGMARKAGTRWTFLDIKHPRQAPYRELAIELLRAERRQEAAKAGDDPDPRALTQDDEAEIEERRKALRRNPLTLVNWWREHRAGPDENLLLLVDQFEELFGYGQNSERDDIEAFVDLLLRSIRDNDVPVYVITTMRAEFLGGCTLFAGLSEQINRSLSLLPRMLMEECREAIIQPVDPDLVTLDPLLVITLLNDMNDLAPWEGQEEAGRKAQALAADPTQALLRQTDLIARRADQLPLMQHVLNWMWTLKADEPSGPDQKIALTLDDYLGLDGLQGALSEHATRVMKSTGDAALTERIFRALTDQPMVSSMGSAESSAVRRPRTIRQLAEETEADEVRVRAIVEAFRAEGVSMLTPGGDRKLTSNTEVDISHESLIRQWADLRRWIRDEAERGRSWRELVRNLEGEDNRPTPVLRGLELADRRRWWREKQPQAGWAERYEGRHYDVDRFIARSVRAERWRKSVLYGVTGSLILLASVGGVFTLVNWRAAKAASLEVSALQIRATGAQREARQATRTMAEARAQATDARAQAAGARIVAETARQLTATARRDAETARQAQQTADARVAQANVALAAAQAARATVDQEAARTRVALGQLYEEQVRPNIRSLSFLSEEQARERFEDAREMLAILRTAETSYVNMAMMELAIQSAALASNDLDASDAVDVVERQAERMPESDLSALMRSESSIQIGRAQLLLGNELGADDAFGRAIDLMEEVEAPSTDTILAVATAQHGRALAQLGLRHRAAAAGAAGICITEAERAIALTSPPPPPPPGSPPASEAVPVTTRASRRRLELLNSGSQLLRIQCLVAAAAAVEDDAGALTQLDGVAREIGQVRPTVENLPGISIAKSNLFLAAAQRMTALEERNAIVPDLRFLTQLWNRETEDWSANSGGGIFVPDDEPVSTPSFSAPRPGAALEQAIMLAGVMRYQLRQGVPRVWFDNHLRQANLLSSVLVQSSYRNNPTIGARVADVLLEHNQLRLEILARSSVGDFPSAALLDGLRSIVAYQRFVEGLAGDNLVARREAALGQAALLLSQFGTAPRIRYPELEGLADAIREVSKACDPQPDAPARCVALIAARQVARDQIDEQTGRLTEERQRAGQRSDPLYHWMDQAGIALGGYDPLTCVARRAGGAQSGSEESDDEASRAPTPNARARSRSSQALQPCRLRRGYYEYAWGINGQVWLFESFENRERFRRRPERYRPRLGGHDTLAMAAGFILPIRGNVYGGVSRRGNLYLFATEGAFISATSDLRTRANRRWDNCVARTGATAASESPESLNSFCAPDLRE